jgi:aspartyl-tRNA(Asn)/glutamyl-tRNA(Gln) amidotransferase subunit A
MSMDLCDRPLHELHHMRLAKQVSAEEIARAVLARIERVEPRVRAYITLTPEGVLEHARAADRKLALGERLSPIEGLPIALKDIFCTRGVKTTCGSRILAEFVPPYDATIVARLRAQGMNLAGKTNMDEFAMGSSTENSAFGPTCNPWDLSRVPGGSSGGMAAAVAAGEALAGIGTDTGGSIRQPAAFTSLVGLKPTYGRVSRYGMIAFASSLDQGGPLTRDVTDAAILLEMIAGFDPRDSTSADRHVPIYTETLSGGLRGRKVGLVREIQGQGQMDAEVARQFQDNLKTLESLGAEPVEVSLPHLEYAIAVYYILAPSEASSNLGRYDGVRYGLRADGGGDLESLYKKTREAGFGPEVKRRIMLGTFALSAGYYDAYYNRAMKIRELLRRDFARAFAEVDLIALPTSPVPAFKLGEKLNDPLQMYLVDAFTLPANLAGLPGISIPGGFTAAGLPLGFQLIADHFAEEHLLQAAKAFEDATEHHRRRPKLE